jgi:chemotaxis protein MotA
MLVAIGVVVLLVMVFGGFVITGGNITPVLTAIPHEMMIIGGAAVGAMIVGNSMAQIKSVGRALLMVVKGPRYHRQDYLETIFLVSKLMKMLQTDGPVAVEPHIEEPESSPIFEDYPRLLADKPLVHLICDTLRLVVVSSGTLSPHAVEEVMEHTLKTRQHETRQPIEALTSLADALPALGIVAAVLGVVKTMGSIDKPPEILGEMIGSALVGTFLGVFLAYGIVGPLATRLKHILDEDEAIYDVAKQIIVASLHGHPLPLVIEAARAGVASANQPTFTEVFDGMRGR